jgi:hypothetical protein
MVFSRFLRPKPRLVPAPGDPAYIPVMALLMFAPLAVGLIGVAMGQSEIWDLRNYHWYNAFAFVTGRYASGIDFAPSQLQFFHNPLIDVPFYLLATHVPARCAYFVLGCVQGLNFPLLFMLGHAVLEMRDAARKAIICALLAALGMAGGVGIGEFGMPFYDNIASLGVLGSALLVVARFEDMTKNPWRQAALLALVAGIPVGVATGLKMTTAVFCVGLCAAIPVTLRLSERGILLGFFFGLGILLGVGAAYAHWGWYLAAHFHSPMFPYFNRLFHSPYVAPVYIEDFAAPRGLLVPLLYPFLFTADPVLVNEIPFRDLRIPLLYIVMAGTGLLALLPRKKTDTPVQTSTFLLWAAGFSYLVWISVEAYYRYLLPLEMLAPLLIMLCCQRFPVTPRCQAGIAGVLLLLVAFTVQPARWERRLEWSGGIAKIERPDIPDAEHTMVLMAGEDAYAYMIPEFPPEVSFVRLESRAFHLDYNWGTNDLIRARLTAHKGPLKLLVPARQLKTSAPALSYFDLKANEGRCQDVIDDMPENDRDREFPKFYKLCDVVRK